MAVAVSRAALRRDSGAVGAAQRSTDSSTLLIQPLSFWACSVPAPVLSVCPKQAGRQPHQPCSSIHTEAQLLNSYSPSINFWSLTSTTQLYPLYLVCYRQEFPRSGTPPHLFQYHHKQPKCRGDHRIPRRSVPQRIKQRSSRCSSWSQTRCVLTARGTNVCSQTTFCDAFNSRRRHLLTKPPTRSSMGQLEPGCLHLHPLLRHSPKYGRPHQSCQVRRPRFLDRRANAEHSQLGQRAREQVLGVQVGGWPRALRGQDRELHPYKVRAQEMGDGWTYSGSRFARRRW